MDSQLENQDLVKTTEIKGSYSESEKREILASIEALVKQSRKHPAGPSSYKVKAKKNGILFPLVMNLLGALLIVGGYFGLQEFFRGRENSLKTRTNQIFSTEGRLLAKLKAEAAAQLEAKNQELLQLETEKNGLADQFSQELLTRTKELEEQLQKTLEQERLKLKGQGLSESEIEKQLRALEVQKSQEIQSEITKLKNQSDAALQAKQRELDSLKTQMATLQADANQEEDVELQAELAAQKRSLEQLREAQAEETRYYQKLGSYYSALKPQLESLKLAEALETVAGLESHFADVQSTTLESLKSRAQGDFTSVQMLKGAIGEIQRLQNLPPPAVEPVVREVVDPRLTEFQKALTGIENAPETQRFGLLTEALTPLPEVQKALTLVRTLEKSAETNQRTLLVRRALEVLDRDGVTAGYQALLQAVGQDSPPLQTGLEKAVTLREEPLRLALAEGEARVKSQETTILDLQNQLSLALADQPEVVGEIASLRESLKLSQDQLEKLKQDLVLSQDSLAALDQTYQNLQQEAALQAQALDEARKALASGAAPSNVLADPELAALSQYKKDVEVLVSAYNLALQEILSSTDSSDNLTKVRALLQEPFEKTPFGQKNLPSFTLALEKLLTVQRLQTTVNLQGLTTGRDKIVAHILLGTVARIEDSAAEVEPLFAQSGLVGKKVEIRRLVDGREKVLGQGQIEQYKGNILELKITEKTQAIFPGDAVYQEY